MDDFRIEHDSIGEVKVDNSKYWAAQTQRSYQNFKIGTEKMPAEITRAFMYLKRSAAVVNNELGNLDDRRKNAIVQACDEILSGKLADNFPLAIWQTGSGTQSNMNMNEVIANRATEILGGNFRDKAHEKKENIVHPNDHVNRGQSSNDTFPTALHIMAVYEVEKLLIPAIDRLRGSLQSRVEAFKDIIKTGRTHLQDATPLTLGQEFSGYVSMLDHSKAQILKALDSCRELAIGGTAVGTGLNAPEGYDVLVAAEISRATGLKFVSDPNKFHGLTSHDAVVFLEGALKGLAADLMKIANDIRWLASGPRCGLGELNIPANEPGSSIMPGKVNPTQCEALTMVCAQVFGHNTTMTLCAGSGAFQLNVYMPIMIYDFVESCRLLADAMNSFTTHCIDGVEFVPEKLKFFVEQSLMIATSLTPYIGYDKSAKVVKEAYKRGCSIKEIILEEKLMTEDEFAEAVRMK